MRHRFHSSDTSADADQRNLYPITSEAEHNQCDLNTETQTPSETHLADMGYPRSGDMLVDRLVH